MNDEKKMNKLRTAVENISLIPMVILIFFEMTAVQRVILSSCILLLITIELVFCGILKDSKRIVISGALYVLWLIALIVNVFRV